MERAPAALDVDPLLAAAAKQLDQPKLRQRYRDQDEFVVVEDFLPAAVLRQWEVELEWLKPHIHRSCIPKHKKGGSVGYDAIRTVAPTINAVYQSASLQQMLRSLVEESRLKECPAADLHRCALYAYTEEGDHIDWHYDTSYYKDRRWTLLVGLCDRSSARLLCRLHTRQPGHDVEERSLQVRPGTLVLFNGEKVYHAVTPTNRGEHRFMVTMQYVTSTDMTPVRRFISNMKDAIAYFGLRKVFFGKANTLPPRACAAHAGTASQAQDPWPAAKA